MNSADRNRPPPDSSFKVLRKMETSVTTGSPSGAPAWKMAAAVSCPLKMLSEIAVSEPALRKSTPVLSDAMTLCETVTLSPIWSALSLAEILLLSIVLPPSATTPRWLFWMVKPLSVEALNSSMASLPPPSTTASPAAVG